MSQCHLGDIRFCGKSAPWQIKAQELSLQQAPASLCPIFCSRPPPGSQGATRKYKVWMRHRYQSCCARLGELLAHPSFQVKVSECGVCSWLLVLGYCIHLLRALLVALGRDSVESTPPQESALTVLMDFVQLEGTHPLEKPKWEGSYLFPRELLKVRPGQWLAAPPLPH